MTCSGFCKCHGIPLGGDKCFGIKTYSCCVDCFIPPKIVISKVFANGFCVNGCVRNLTISSDGTVLYIDSTGNKVGKITDEQFNDLVKLFDENFFDLKDSYNCEIAPTDVGGTTFIYIDNTKQKSVWSYGGCKQPSELIAINSELNNIQDSLK